MAEAIDSLRVTRRMVAEVTGPEVPLVPLGPDPTTDSWANVCVAPPRRADDDWILTDGTVGAREVEATAPAAEVGTLGTPAAVTVVTGPAFLAGLGGRATATADGRLLPVLRGCPVRATIWADPTAISALPAAAAFLPVGGDAPSRRKAALGATWLIRLAGIPPDAAGVDCCGCDSATIEDDGRLAPLF